MLIGLMMVVAAFVVALVLVGVYLVSKYVLLLALRRRPAKAREERAEQVFALDSGDLRLSRAWSHSAPSPPSPDDSPPPPPTPYDNIARSHSLHGPALHALRHHHHLTAHRPPPSYDQMSGISSLSRDGGSPCQSFSPPSRRRIPLDLHPQDLLQPSAELLRPSRSYGGQELRGSYERQRSFAADERRLERRQRRSLAVPSAHYDWAQGEEVGRTSLVRVSAQLHRALTVEQLSQDSAYLHPRPRPSRHRHSQPSLRFSQTLPAHLSALQGPPSPPLGPRLSESGQGFPRLDSLLFGREAEFVQPSERRDLGRSASQDSSSRTPSSQRRDSGRRPPLRHPLQLPGHLVHADF